MNNNDIVFNTIKKYQGYDLELTLSNVREGTYRDCEEQFPDCKSIFADMLIKVSNLNSGNRYLFKGTLHYIPYIDEDCGCFDDPEDRLTNNSLIISEYTSGNSVDVYIWDENPGTYFSILENKEMPNPNWRKISESICWDTGIDCLIADYLVDEGIDPEDIDLCDVRDTFQSDGVPFLKPDWLKAETEKLRMQVKRDASRMLA